MAEPSRVPDAIFAKIAKRYDLINTVLSMGRDQAWRRKTVSYLPRGRLLDLGSGTGAAAPVFGDREVVALDPVDRMLALSPISWRVVAMGEGLPFADDSFDVVSVAFGLRNMTHKEIALQEMLRVLRRGGRLFVLEFSRVRKALAPLYDLYSFRVLPWLGARVAGDAAAYQYLAESIRRHPDQAALAEMMRQAGFAQVEVYNLAAGVVAVHRGVRL